MLIFNVAYVIVFVSDSDQSRERVVLQTTENYNRSNGLVWNEGVSQANALEIYRELSKGVQVPRDNQGETAASIRMRMRRGWPDGARA